MESIIIAFHVIAAISIIGLVLIQHGKGADMGASFGSGGSQTMLGAVGSGNALTTSTTVLAVVFFITSLGLGMVAREAANLNITNDALIGDIDQVNAQLSVDAETAAVLSDLPSVEVGEGDIPVFEDIPAGGDMPVVDDISVEE